MNKRTKNVLRIAACVIAAAALLLAFTPTITGSKKDPADTVVKTDTDRVERPDVVRERIKEPVEIEEVDVSVVEGEDTVDFSTKILLAQIEYMLEEREAAEAADGENTETQYDGFVSLWIGPTDDRRSFYLTISEMKESEAESDSGPALLQGIVYADAFICDCRATTLLYPGGVSQFMRDSSETLIGYPTIQIIDQSGVHKYEITVEDGHIVLKDGAAELRPIASTAEADDAPALAERKIWYCDMPVINSIPNDRSSITLFPETKRFGLYLSALTPELGTGDYDESADGTVTLHEASGDLTFTKSDGALQYSAAASSGQTNDAFSDGAVFRSDLYFGEMFSKYDEQRFDMDGDGVEDRCLIGAGRSSGMFSFTVTATTEDGVLICGGAFATKTYTALKFAEDGGNHVITATDESGGEDKLFFKTIGQMIVLTDDKGVPMEQKDAPGGPGGPPR